MAAFSTIALATVAAISAASAVNSGVQGARSQKKSREQQQVAQQQAEASAMKQDKRGAEEIARASQKRPDIAAILAEAQTGASRSPNTLLTGGNTLLGR